MGTTHLIRRDLPLEPGRKLSFVFTVAFEVTLDEDVLDYDGDGTREGERGLKAATLDEIEGWLGDPHRSPESIYRYLSANRDRNVIEHKVTLDDRYEGADEGELRFETGWEQREREQGQMQNWLSRVWLDEIPGAGALPLGPGSNPPVPAEDSLITAVREEFAKPLSDARTVVVAEHPSAAEVMERDG